MLLKFSDFSVRYYVREVTSDAIYFHQQPGTWIDRRTWTLTIGDGVHPSGKTTEYTLNSDYVGGGRIISNVVVDPRVFIQSLSQDRVLDPRVPFKVYGDPFQGDVSIVSVLGAVQHAGWGTKRKGGGVEGVYFF